MKLQLIQNSFLAVTSFISAERAQLLASDFLAHEKKYGLTLDGQCPSSPAMYDFMPFVRLMVEKVSEVGELIGEPVLPTYTYARVYKNGEILARHQDRPACEISLTLNLSKTANWPICIQRPDGSEICLEQQPGDAMLYLGCVADHWREPYGGDEHVQVFLHYVRANGPKAWAYFDKKQEQEPTPPVGELPVSRL
jgi:hypothetical protein